MNSGSSTSSTDLRFLFPARVGNTWCKLKAYTLFGGYGELPFHIFKGRRAND